MLARAFLEEKLRDLAVPAVETQALGSYFTWRVSWDTCKLRVQNNLTISLGRIISVTVNYGMLKHKYINET